MLDKAAAKSAAALFVCKNYGVIEKGRISGREMRKWHISLSNIPDGGLLQGERIYILNTDFMSLRDAIVTFEFYSSCGFHVLLRYFAIEKLRERSFQLVYFAREEYLIAKEFI